MSSSPLPAYLDIRKVFTQQVELEGSMALERLPRLQQVLAGDQAEIHARLKCSISADGHRLVSGQVEAIVTVICQRCLEPLEIQLQDRINLAVLDHEDQATGLDSALDPWVCGDHRLDLKELLEEQLILCLPVVNYHDDRECLGKTRFGEGGVDSGQAATSEEHPFAVLKALKEKDEKV